MNIVRSLSYVAVRTDITGNGRSPGRARGAGGGVGTLKGVGLFEMFLKSILIPKL